MARFVLPLVLMLVWASTAHAQKVPEFVVWSAGAALFAPFVAVPIKVGLLRLLGLNVDTSRLWAIAAIEWLLWFPLAFLVLRPGRSSGLPLTLPALLFAAVWLQRVRVPTERWASALYLALPTPVLALALPFAAIAAGMLTESVRR